MTTAKTCGAILLTLFVCLMFMTAATDSNNNNENSKKVHIAVYYESLCPDSVQFIMHQLAPTYEQFKNYIDLQFVPFGKSESENNGATFFCQHGPAECSGNRLQSCTLNELRNDQDKQMRYVSCQMRWDADYTGQNCANLVGVNYANVNDCFIGELGKQLQLDAEEQTHLIAKPYPRFVPTIVFNRIFNQRKQNRSQWELRNVICDELISTLTIDELPSLCVARKTIVSKR